MADFPPSTGTSALIASDLIIEIQPRWICRFHGTAAQLIAEGLIPDGFKWPSRTNRVRWESGKFNYGLQRTRPIGKKGPMSSWADGDYWVLDRSEKGQSDYFTHLILQKTRELSELIQRGMPEWRRISNLAWEAKEDEKYQAFRGLVVPAQKRRGRPAKTTATQAQGASA